MKAFRLRDNYRSDPVAFAIDLLLLRLEPPIICKRHDYIGMGLSKVALLPGSGTAFYLFDSAKICRATSRGSTAWRMGRPTTTASAPKAKACSGVFTRFWSPKSLPAGRTPGVTILKLRWQPARNASISH